eukprot:TRINITY_DN405_c0_g2_i1.p1 TRINITY_DN405_c0_g2~~TRINITY_DN405_c0_g2_i1.p1  ORF type:complete len:1035 (+),score=454.27 TRINITY_DN405_c0_g2_i1:71-3175(+)
MANVFTVRSKQERDKLQEAAKPLVRNELGPLGDAEVEWFCGNLGLSRRYFASVGPDDVAKHTMLLFAAKFRARVAGHKFGLDISDEGRDRAIYICPSKDTTDPKVAQESASAEVEKRIEAIYLDEAWHATQTPHNAGQSAEASKADQIQAQGGSEVPCEGYVVEAFRSSGEVARTVPIRLRLFVVQRPNYPDAAGESGIASLACSQFLNFISPKFFPEYETLLARAATSNGCVVSTSMPAEEDWSEHSMHNEEQDIVVRVAHKRGTTHSFYSSASQLYRMHGFRSRVKAIWPFRNAIDIQTVWLSPMEPISYKELQKRVESVKLHLTLSYILPRTPFTSLVANRQLGASEHAYAYCALVYAHHFLTLRPNETDSAAPYKATLFPEIDTSSHQTSGRIKMRLRQNMLTEPRLAEAVLKYPEIVSKLYSAFEELHAPWTPVGDRFNPKTEENLAKMIVRQVPNEINQRVLLCFLTFNKWILKTNFFKEDRNVLAFRLDPRVMDNSEYPETPYGIFLVCGSVFRGFHIRFRDVARGGIRLIKSANEQAYANNVATLLEENYALAMTQQQKNKDIPEGGSKGTILLAPDHQDKGHVAFDQYIDGILDVLLPDKRMKDYLGEPEILFFGPDENTADKMDRAAQRAKQRGYALWKASTTGKSIAMGGIPHDTYGMTTRSVHQYVLGFYRQLELQESTIKKFQTGGPDGDLGSNEILISHDKTLTIVDGSGVLHDPEGLNREELQRLATSRQMACHFNQKMLSPAGFFVDVRDVDRTLPDGSLVQSGLQFRNGFHLDPRAAADLFVPCGGRPESINVSNVHQLFSAKGEPRFKIIVEGANLFLTQGARHKLEAAGVHLVKDASANKGGVTSSSLEVLTALSLADEEFKQLMTAPTGTPPDSMPAFYRSYVTEVQARIEENARMEFECLWSEWKKLGGNVPMSNLTDILSAKINALNDRIQQSTLWDDVALRSIVFTKYVPKTLLDHIGMEKLQQRVPESYLRSIFGCYLAAQYIYSYGPSASEFDFFDFITRFRSVSPAKL